MQRHLLSWETALIAAFTISQIAPQVWAGQKPVVPMTGTFVGGGRLELLVLTIDDSKATHEEIFDIGHVTTKGAAVERDEVVCFAWRGEAGATLPRKCHVIRWSKRVYLVPEEVMFDFARNVRLGLEPHWEEKSRGHGSRSYFVLESEMNSKVLGIPELPRSFPKSLLLEPPIGKVIKWEGQEGIVSLGSQHGARIGTVLGIVNEKRERVIRAEIVAIAEEISVVRSLDPANELVVGAAVTSEIDAYSLLKPITP